MKLIYYLTKEINRETSRCDIFKIFLAFCHSCICV